MEIPDQFDKGYPLGGLSCELVSVEDLEQQAVSYTQQRRHELLSNVEPNPRICEGSEKAESEKEDADLVSCLKAKIFQALRGELNDTNYMSTEEMKEKMLQLS